MLKMKISYSFFFGINALVTAMPARQPEAIQPPAQAVKVSIALQPESRQMLEQTLNDLSSPTSSRYGQYLGRKEAKALLWPRQSSANVVKRWLSQAGIPAGHVLSDEQFIHVQIDAGRAKVLLGTDYNATLGSQTIAVYSLPRRIQDHVMTIQYAPVHPRTACPVSKSNSSSIDLDVAQSRTGQYLTKTRADWEKCKTEITPACLRKLYHVGDRQVRHEKKSLLGVAGFDGVSPYLTAAFYSFHLSY